MGGKRRVAIAIELEQPFAHHTQVFAGALRYAEEHDWECVIDEFPAYKSNQRPARFRDYDGVIARADPRMAARLRRKRIPLVNTWFSSPVKNVPGVYLDLAEVGRLAVRHLVDRAYRQIIMFGSTATRDERVVAEAVAEASAEAGVRVHFFDHPVVKIANPESWLQQERAICRSLEDVEPPVGIFGVPSSAVRYVANLCLGLGWHVPGDVALLCAMGTPGHVDLPRPSLSSIDMKWDLVGYEAAALLDRLLDGQPPPKGPILIPPSGVVARESTDHIAVEDNLVAAELEHICSHMRERLTVEDIATKLKVSPRLLQCRFAEALERPVSVEIRRLRMEAAKRLLMDKQRRTGDIAEEVGFRLATRMNEVFQRELGMTPGTYRKQVLGERAKR